MANTYEKLIHGPLLSELVDGGFLATPYFLTLPVNESMKYDTVKGNESAARVFKANDVDIVYESIIEAYNHVCSIARKKLTALVFAISRAHGKRLNQEFINAGIDSQYLDSLSTKEERKRIVEDFREGKLQVMVNIDLFGEGFDAPNCDAVLMARPTSSEILFFQQCGRALRPAEGKKYGYIMDCAGNCRRILDAPGLVNRVYTFETVESSGSVVGKASMKQQAISNVDSITSTEKNEQKGEVYVNEDEWDVTIGVISERNANIRKLNRLLISGKKTGLKGYIEILSYCILCSPSQEEFLKILKRVAEINGYAKGWIHYQLKDWRDNEKNYILMHSRQVEKRDEYINSLKKEKVTT